MYFRLQTCEIKKLLRKWTWKKSKDTSKHEEWGNPVEGNDPIGHDRLSILARLQK